jgi:hypothetical protein
MHSAEPLVPEPGSFVNEIANEKLEKYKLPGINQILGQMIHIGGKSLCPEMHKLIHYILTKEKLPQQ